MKKFYLLLFFFIVLLSFSKAQCPINTIPTNLSATANCGPGVTQLSANISNVNNQLLWLDSANRIIGKGVAISRNVINSTTFKALESNVENITATVGPSPSDFSSTFPSQNFTNGEIFTCLSPISIDSMVLRSNNPVAGNIVFWSKDPALGGYVLQKAPFQINSTGVINTKVPVGVILNQGNYFVNLEVTSGSGILYRANSGANYPYTSNGLLSITASNFNTATDRYYYFFNWKISKVCLGNSSNSITAVVQPNPSETFPYLANQEIPCDWQQSKAAGANGWLSGDTISLSSQGFHIPGFQGSGFWASNDDTCNCNSSANLLYTDYFDFRSTSVYSKIRSNFQYVYKQVGNSKVKIVASIGNGPFNVYDSLTGAAEWKQKNIILSPFYGKDSVRFGFLHEDAGTNGSGVAIRDFYISSNIDSCRGILYTLDLVNDIYASEVKWKLIQENGKIIVAESGNYEDVNPYNLTASTHQNVFCLIPGEKYKFKITDSFGDGLFDGTNTGSYVLKNVCTDTLLQGSGSLPYGGQLPLPNASWDSIVFTAGNYFIDLGLDQTILTTEELELDAGDHGPYLWSTGETTRLKTVKGKFGNLGLRTISVIVGSGLCISKDTININVIPATYTEIIVTTLTDQNASEVSWTLKDFNSDTLIKSSGSYINVIPYNILTATHIDTIQLLKNQKVKFKIIDQAGNGLYDGANFGFLNIKTNCQPQFFHSSGISFPYASSGIAKFDSVNFVAGSTAKINLGVDQSICFGDSVFLNAGSTNGVYWSSGDTGQQVIIKPSYLSVGIHNLIVETDEGECYTADTISILVNPIPLADFNFNINQRTVQFTSAAVIGNLYQWDFGDGNQTVGSSVSHTYNNNGNFTVTLDVVSNNNCINSNSKLVLINFNNIDLTKNINYFRSFPNPVSEFLQLHFELEFIEPVSINIFNLNGQLVKSFAYQLNNNSSNDFQINLNDLYNGFYLLELKGERTLIHRNLIIQH